MEVYCACNIKNKIQISMRYESISSFAKGKASKVEQAQINQHYLKISIGNVGSMHCQ